MLIIWGWGKQTRKNVGFISRIRCRHCGNDCRHDFQIFREWFTLFFIPVIPYVNRRLISCSVCGNSVDIPKEMSRIMNEDNYLELSKELLDS